MKIPKVTTAEAMNVIGGAVLSGFFCFSGAAMLKVGVLLYRESTTVAASTSSATIALFSLVLCLGVMALTVTTALNWGSKPTALAVTATGHLFVWTVIGLVVTPPAELLKPVSAGIVLACLWITATIPGSGVYFLKRQREALSSLNNSKLPEDAHQNDGGFYTEV